MKQTNQRRTWKNPDEAMHEQDISKIRGKGAVLVTVKYSKYREETGQ